MTTRDNDDFDLGAHLQSLESVEDFDKGRKPHEEIAERRASETGIRPVDAHACFECSGTGIYQGTRIHQEKVHCFACKGKGWFKTSYADRLKAKQRTAERKANAQDAKQEAFIEAHPGVIEGLREVCGWSEFAASLLSGFEKWGSLTENQTLAAQRHLAKIAAGRAERQKEQAKKGGEVGVEAIEKLFSTAQQNGLKRPRFLTARLQISLAPATGRNAGALYVKCDGEYAGKIVNGQLIATREAPKDILDLVRELAADPLETARKYGRDTGTCSCCGRELTDQASIAKGIGPVCESKWF